MKSIINSWFKKKKLHESLGDPSTNPSGNPGMGDMGGMGGMGAGQPGQPSQDPNAANPPAPTAPDAGSGPQDPSKPGQQPDVTTDPQAPDMPGDHEEMDFEQWKDSYFKESVKGDVNKMIDMIHQVRDLELDPYPRKFVEDNLQICFLRQNANIDKAGKEIRKLIKQELDQNNPSVTLVNHMNTVLAQMPELSNVFVKLKGLLGMKGDLHRKYIGALLGGTQVGTGQNAEDIIYNEKMYSIRISTRYNDKWGRVDIGKWALREDDPDRYLSEPELKRLQGEGSPGEKEELRKRIVIESIAEQFKERAFIINVTGKNGTVYTVGWDLAGSMKAAYTQGKLVVRTIQSENSDSMITDDGEIVPFVDIKIRYVKETGGQDEDGKPEKEEHDFLERIDGMLFLTARFNILREAASSFQGIILKETPYTGNPSDLRVLTRCVPSSAECLLRQCAIMLLHFCCGYAIV